MVKLIEKRGHFFVRAGQFDGGSQVVDLDTTGLWQAANERQPALDLLDEFDFDHAIAANPAVLLRFGCASIVDHAR